MKSGAIKFFSMDGKDGIEPSKTVVLNAKSEKFVVLDFGYDEAIRWKGNKAVVDRSKISLLAVPLETYKTVRRMAREAEEKRSETLARKAMEELGKHRQLLKLGDVTVSALPYKLD